MESETYITHLEAKLDELDQNIKRATRLFENEGIAGKAHALDQLAHLRIRRDALARQIEEARAKGAEDWSAMRMSMQEEADAIKDVLENWLTRLK